MGQTDRRTHGQTAHVVGREAGRQKECARQASWLLLQTSPGRTEHLHLTSSQVLRLRLHPLLRTHQQPTKHTTQNNNQPTPTTNRHQQPTPASPGVRSVSHRRLSVHALLPLPPATAAAAAAAAADACCCCCELPLLSGPPRCSNFMESEAERQRRRRRGQVDTPGE